MMRQTSTGLTVSWIRMLPNQLVSGGFRRDQRITVTVRGPAWAGQAWCPANAASIAKFQDRPTGPATPCRCRSYHVAAGGGRHRNR
jgi:hypothetical protein